MSLYYSLIYPHLIYAIQVWGSSFESNLNKLLILQRKLVRLITYNDKVDPNHQGSLVHSAPLFAQLNILRVHDIFKLRATQFIYDCLTGRCTDQFKSWFNRVSDIHSHATRSRTTLEMSELGSAAEQTSLISSYKLFMPSVRTTYYGLRSMKYLGANFWNTLPHILHKANSRSIFGKAMKTHLLSLY